MRVKPRAEKRVREKRAPGKHTPESDVAATPDVLAPEPLPPARPDDPDAGLAAELTGFPVVAVGASAGGLEAFTELLRAVPPDTGMAFVLIQHLAPEHESLLSSLLAGATSMPVIEVRDGMTIERDHVYVIPPNANMTIREGTLRLVARTEERGQHMPIDAFLRSLAEEKRTGAIGVILSGTAYDGVMGLKAIKAEGGITLAQDPRTARFDGMPAASVASGAVDFVLPVRGIADELRNIARHPLVARPSSVDEPVGSDELLGRIFTLLRGASGVDFTHYKHATIKRRIKRRMVLHRIERLPEYLKYLMQNRDEVEALYQDILIHVTGFFRDAEAYEALKKEYLPNFLNNRSPENPLRVWVAGCSTGEEPYSLAITVLEMMGDRAAGPAPVQIFATDISQNAVDRARAGIYPEGIAADLTPDRLRRFFRRTEGGYQISKAVRDMCIFARQDVIKDPPFSNLDLVSCRNLLIYFGPVLQKRVISIFHYALRPGGLLLLGASETIGSFADLFAPLDKRHRIYTKKSLQIRPNFELRASYGVYGLEAKTPPRPPAGPPRSPAGIQGSVERAILDRFAPAGIVVDQDMQILQYRGQTGPFLAPPPGEPNLSALKMAREGLAMDLRTVFQEAKRRNTPTIVQGVRVQQNGKHAFVTIEVLPVDGEGADRRFLILFRDEEREEERASGKDAARTRGKGKAKAEPASRRRKPTSEPTEEMDRLRDELGATREYLQAIIQDQEATNEELQSANEEILSANEELQSTNEELETAKEELQSTNEELNTVNEELQVRNQELGQVNSDLTNLLAAVQIPIVMVGNDLCVRRVTPAAARFFNLIPSDIGRPINDVRPRVRIPDFDRLLTEAIETVSMKETDVEDADGNRHLLRIRPYKSLDNRIEGAVLTLFDQESAPSGDFAESLLRLVEITDEALIALDGKGAILRASRRAEEVLGDGLVGKRLWDAVPGMDGARAREIIDDRLRGEAVVRDQAVSLSGDHGGTVLLNAVRVGEAGPKKILLMTLRREQGA